MPDDSSPITDESGESAQVILRKEASGSKRVSWILDECIRIPRTNFRFGLDPIIGLIPFGGEAVATLFGSLVLGDAGRKGIPFKTLIRMAGNMLLNAVVGLVPGAGDLFSVWFKSNSRNYQMLTEFLNSEEGEQAKGGWWPFLIIASVIGLVLLLNLTAWFFLYQAVQWMLTPTSSA